MKVYGPSMHINTCGAPKTAIGACQALPKVAEASQSDGMDFILISPYSLSFFLSRSKEPIHDTEKT